ncbi:Hypothetical predicted protein [Mytilus galloprovincialis]|uniref:Uncharacterized protein n=1 Tax=Mytilus galloprovincialis TaxID=29158 RepID=A0A8B6HS54_MYTGA|nr:Hypothetical predicted protein [Mytilus galloprovincialis]
MQTTRNNEGSIVVMTQPTENLASQQIIYGKRFKILGGGQIGLGGVLLIMSIVQLIKSASSFLIVYNLPIIICSGWFIMTGCIPLNISKKTESNFKCQKIGFMVCSIIGAAVFVPIMFSLTFIVGLFHLFDEYQNDGYILSYCIAGLSVIEAIVAVISASYCCCCSPWQTSSQQMAVFMSPLPSGMNLNGNQIQDTNIRSWVDTTEKTNTAF